MRATEKLCISQEFTIKYLTNTVGKKTERRRLVEGEKGLSMASDYSYPDNTRKRTLKRKIFKNFSLGKGGKGARVQTSCLPYHILLAPTPFFLDFSFFSPFLKRNIKHRCVIPPYFSRFPSLLGLPLSSKTNISKFQFDLERTDMLRG